MATDVTQMTAGHIEKALELAEREHSDLLDQVIAAGFGMVRYSDLPKHLDGPHGDLIAKHIATHARLSALRDEINRRMRWHGSLRRIRDTP